MKEIAKALAFLYSMGFIHGDLKMLNIVRIKNLLLLIDLDASAKIDTDCVGSKFSSGVLPPEMIHCFDDEKPEKRSQDRKDYEAYFASQDPEERAKRALQKVLCRELLARIVS